MADPGRVVLVSLTGAILWLAAAGCASVSPATAPTSASAAAPRPEPVGEELLDAYAALLRLEDRREFDAPALERHAAATDDRIRARAALTLGRLRRAEGSPLLVRLLADPDTAVAATAAFSLGQLADSTHADALAAILRGAGEGRSTVASEAAYALGKVGGAAARAALLDFLAGRPLGDRSDAAAVGSALLAIWKLPAAAELTPVARWLDADDPELRWRAAYALSRRADARAFPRLLSALADADPRVRSLALRGLSAPLADSSRTPRADLVAEIVPLLGDADYGVAISAARTLGSYGEAAAIAALAVAATAPPRHLAITALESLARVGAPARAHAGVIALLTRTDSLPIAVRAAALEALARVDSATAYEVATGLAASPEWRLRASAARALALVEAPALLTGRSSGALEPLLRDPDPRVAGAALQAAIDAVGDSISGLRSLLVDQLRARDVMVRAAALTAAARLEDPSLLPALLDAYGRAQVDSLNDAALAAVDAIAALEREGTRPSRSFFARFPRSPDALVRRKVAARFDSATVAAEWGPALPVETERGPGDYRALVDDLVAPALRGQGPPTLMVATAGDTIVLRLFPVDAPLTVESFLNLAASGYFDGQEWPRLVANFVVQGGDPRGDTSGGPGYSIRDEMSRHRYAAGTLGMALAGPDTGGSQFFITHSPQPHLDGTYAIFGEVVAGQEVTERLLPGDTIEEIRRMPE